MFHLISLIFFLLSTPILKATSTFIALVHPLSKPSPFFHHKFWYTSIISSSSSSPSPAASIVHIYDAPIHGFSAILTNEQVKIIRKLPGVLSLYPDRVLHLHTTRSPSFLGLQLQLQNPNSSSSNTPESDSIIGFIDTGIWPEHPSFSDHNIGPIPSRWNGRCQNGFKFNHTNCNRKIIGAAFFSGGYDAWFGQSDKPRPGNKFRSARDSDGHGTHVASIAAGAPVPRSGFFGFASGLARGIAPTARISVYKVCWDSGCLLSDVCKAFETAISDGVDIISLSLGSSRLPFYLDLLSIVSFRAFSKGIFVAASAGNEGPAPATVANEPPWVTTVGAGTIDRDFPATINLKNNVSVIGTSITLMPNNKLNRRKFYPLHLVGDKLNFSRKLTEGKIVVYRPKRYVARMPTGAAFRRAGAIAMVISHGHIDPNGLISEPHVIPTITIGVQEAKRIEAYILSNKNPTAKISSQGTIPMHAKPAPIVTSFSSRGPNSFVPWVLKPDVIAPGVNILGAWTDVIGPSGISSDHRRSMYNVMSGTSMACPHVSGTAALIKSKHPEWGPSEIKSALMTTSTVLERFPGSSPISDESTGNAATPFDVGSGLMLPIKAMDPDLIFDLEHKDYVNFLCHELNYTKRQLQIITGKKSHCSNDGTWQLNYPSIAVNAEKVRHAGRVVVARKMKNVNAESREYMAKIVGPKGYYRVEVKPKRLKFSGKSESLNFKIFVMKEKSVKEMKTLWFGAVIWRETRGMHKVKCPIVIFSAKDVIR